MRVKIQYFTFRWKERVKNGDFHPFRQFDEHQARLWSGMIKKGRVLTQSCACLRLWTRGTLFSFSPTLSHLWVICHIIARGVRSSLLSRALEIARVKEG